MRREGHLYYRGPNPLSTKEINELIFLGEERKRATLTLTKFKHVCTQFKRIVRLYVDSGLRWDGKNSWSYPHESQKELESLGFDFMEVDEDPSLSELRFDRIMDVPR